MGYELNISNWKRFFSVPCALVDNYLKLADGPALKVLLYLIACEDSPDRQSIIDATGIKSEALDEAVMFWRSLGVMKSDGETQAQKPATSPEISAIVSSQSEEPVRKVIHSRYAPKDIADMITTDPELRELFSEAESTLGRILKHSDHEVLISLKDYYGFSEQSIVLILSYCSELGKTSARYYETVAKGLFDNGTTDFRSIEAEFELRKEHHSFESQVRSDFGLDIKLTSRQSQYINSWKEMGFGLNMISLARERCADQTNKLSFQYINKILSSWKEKGIMTPEAAENEQKPQKAEKTERSFDLDEFDMFTLSGSGKETK